MIYPAYIVLNVKVRRIILSRSAAIRWIVGVSVARSPLRPNGRKLSGNLNEEHTLNNFNHIRYFVGLLGSYCWRLSRAERGNSGTDE